ncbi:hypothetical protein NUM3379_29700 [Kineococcus sp. NUM-3379]
MLTRRAATRLLLAAASSTAIALTAACGGEPAAPPAENPYGLLTPGVIRAGTLTDAPPNVYLENGVFTGFDNELLRAVAAKLDLEVEFVGTDFSALLSQVANKQFDVGSSSITITEKRKQTVAFTHGYDFGYQGLDVPAGSTITDFGQLAGRRVVVVQGTVQDDYATKNDLDPVRVPDYNTAANQLKAGTADAWVSPAEIGEKIAVDSGGGILFAAKEITDQPTAFAVAKGNTALLEALNGALDEVVADGTWYELEQRFYPGREIPAEFRPGSGSVAVNTAAPSASPSAS